MNLCVTLETSLGDLASNQPALHHGSKLAALTLAKHPALPLYVSTHDFEIAEALE
jgi:hypothetical protein